MAAEPLMATGHVYIATSLDGFIARRDGGVDWLDPYVADGEDYGFNAFMDSVDGLVMGRGTFEKVLTFGPWPYSKPVVVLSQTRRDVPEELSENVCISDASPVEIMQQLAEEGWHRVYVDGGKVIQAFLRENLIEDLIITRVPVLLGDGIPLFGPLDADIGLSHLKTIDYPSGLVQSTYALNLAPT